MNLESPTECRVFKRGAGLERDPDLE
jgi:hypothetical protein